QAMSLHRRMKSADDCYPGAAQFVRQVIGLNDQLAWTTDGAEKRQGVSLENLEIAEDRYQFRRTVAEVRCQRGGIARVGTKDLARSLHKSDYLTGSDVSDTGPFPA